MAKKRTPPKSIFIGCEGSNTEPIYFGKIKEIMEDDDAYPYAITIYPNKEYDENPKTDAIGLVKVAIERKKDFDELWVVFDKDGYTKHNEAFELAKEHGIKIAFSSISFEIWVLLHFERNITAFVKSAMIIDNKFRNNERYLPDYAKSGDYNLYPYIKENTQQAFENASFLRKMLNGKIPNFEIHEINPYTNVDFLVKKLVLNDNVYEFILLDQSLNFNDVEIIVNYVNEEYIVKIANLANKSIVLNEFSFYDFKRNKIVLDNLLIHQGDFREIKLDRIAMRPQFFIEFENLILEIGTS